MAVLYEIKLEGYSALPYWIHEGLFHGFSHDSDKADYLIEYRLGIHEPLELGTTRAINGKEYKYLDSVLLDQELELQTEDNKYTYVYQGEHFLRIWEAII